MIRVALADDQRLVLAGFGELIQHESDLEVVATAANGLEAVDAARRLRPDVVLMDVRMPELDGIEATHRITSDPSLDRTKVIVLTTFAMDDYVINALKAGASGFLLKDIEPADLLNAIRIVHAGDALLSPAVTRQLIQHHVQNEPEQLDASRLEPLTDREREVVALVACGMNNAEIGEALFISPLTAKTHVSRSLQKLALRDRAQLVIAAYESGLVSPGEDPPA